MNDLTKLIKQTKNLEEELNLLQEIFKNSNAQFISMTMLLFHSLADIFVLEISLPLCMTLDSKLQKLINKPQGQ
ncbi:MAG: hypothetical protein IJ077_05765 [Eubacterium sp.]|nr:hypothetical protein [Eubacterium sp.]MBR2278758.1 hypothetical protein [Eubacterium sp.]